MLIRISGTAVVKSQRKATLSESVLKKLDGAKSRDKCSNYIDPDLAALGLTGGHITLSYEPAKCRWRVTTEYRSPVKLTRSQLNQLSKNTAGQWSDGIGEGDFDHLCDKLGVTIDLLQKGKGPTVEQIDDGRKVAKSKTGLAMAAKEGNLDKALVLLDAGANTESKLQGYTALHLALNFGHWKIALELIERGANILVCTPTGFDSILLVAKSEELTDVRSAQIATALLDRGAPVYGVKGPNANPKNDREFTPLYMAKVCRKSKLAAVLKKYGARK